MESSNGFCMQSVIGQNSQFCGGRCDARPWMRSVRPLCSFIIYILIILSGRCLSELIKYFGAPKILHSDNGREFIDSIVFRILQDWPGVSFVHSKTRNPSTQGLIEQANGVVETRLAKWQLDTGRNDWSNGLLTVQCMFFFNVLSYY